MTRERVLAWRAPVFAGRYHASVSERSEDWVPSDDDLAYWRFLRLTGRSLAAWLCLNEGVASMWARPREAWLRQTFRGKHAGHEHVFVAEILDRFLAAKRQP